MDVTPLIPSSRMLIEGYGDRRFRISGNVHEGHVLVLPEAVHSWPVADLASAGADSLLPLIERAAEIDVLLIGCGPKMMPVPPALRASLSGARIVPEPMDTGAACRTYNVLLSEDRRVAAALIAY